MQLRHLLTFSENFVNLHMYLLLAFVLLLLVQETVYAVHVPVCF